MMYPELMEIVVRSHHEYLRSLARGDSVMDDVRFVSRSLRNALGDGLVRAGRWLEGHTSPPVSPNRGSALQES